MLKNIIIIVLTFLFTMVLVHFADRYVKCEKDGYPRGVALKFAELKLEYDGRNSEQFELIDERFWDYDKLWTFTFASPHCTIDVIIDKCGRMDVGGISGDCKSK